MYIGPLIIEYVDRLKKVYKAPPPNWNPLPKCEHIKLAMIRVKGKRRGIADEIMVRRKMRGEVEAIVADKVPVELDRIFDSRLFAEERQVILVEGGPGMGKTTLAYHFGQEWAKGNLQKFEIVALISLCNIAPTSTLADLLLLACESTEEMVKEILESISKLLLVLDGWDEAPDQIRDVQFLTNIIRSLSSESKILITSRCDSSAMLHGIANRVEILGFNKEKIHEYFQKALSTELEDDQVESKCQKLREHLHNHPVILSCCSSPLNAAILAHLFLTKNSLPSTRHELFLMLVLSRINRELKLHSSQEKTEFVSSDSLSDLPCKHKFDYLCEVAFEGEQNNKVIFSQKELARLNLQPADISALGLLQIDDSFSSTGGLTNHYYFIHHSIQELLAAYHISQLKDEVQHKIFQTLLNEPRLSDVLQFYAAFTALTNKGVQKLISGSNFSSGSLLTVIRCFFEAKMDDLSLYKAIISKLSKQLNLSNVTLSPFDCMSVGYFLAIGFIASGELSVDLSLCSIDDHSLNLFLENLSKHGQPCASQGFKKLNLSGNKIGDKGIAIIVTALQKKKITIETLHCCDCGISSAGVKLLDSARAKHLLEELKIRDDGITQADTGLETSSSGFLSKAKKKLQKLNCIPDNCTII